MEIFKHREGKTDFLAFKMINTEHTEGGGEAFSPVSQRQECESTGRC